MPKVTKDAGRTSPVTAGELRKEIEKISKSVEAAQNSLKRLRKDAIIVEMKSSDKKLYASSPAPEQAPTYLLGPLCRGVLAEGTKPPIYLAGSHCNPKLIGQHRPLGDPPIVIEADDFHKALGTIRVLLKQMIEVLR
jgi:hypothetical protein